MATDENGTNDNWVGVMSAGKLPGMPGKICSPPLSDWECELFGTGSNGMKFTTHVGNVPNAFWRWMQYILLGNRWRRRK